MKKSKLIFYVLILLIAGFVFIKRANILNYFEPRLQDVEKLAVDAAIKEIRKEFQAPPPLRLSTRSAPPTPQTSANQPLLTTSGTIKWTNIQRKNNGNLAPLAENPTLDTIALLRLQDMFAKQYFAHIAPDGSGAETVAKSVGYDYIALGENLALGNFFNDEDLVRAWMNSPGHRANILNTKYQEIGVAVKKGIFEGKSAWIGVQIFGKPTSSCPAIDPGLKSKIDSSESQLQEQEKTLAAEKTDIENTQPKGGPEYNAKINQYNELVAQYNSLLEQTKSLISEYNNEVNAFNQCLAQ